MLKRVRPLKPIVHHSINPGMSIPAESRAHYVPLDDTLMVVTDDFLLTSLVLDLVLRLAPDTVLDPGALLETVIFL